MLLNFGRFPYEQNLSTSLSFIYPLKVLLNFIEAILFYIFITHVLKKEQFSKVITVLLTSFSLVMVYGIIEKLFISPNVILDLYRVQSTFNHPNIYASFLLLLGPLFLWRFQSYKTKKGNLFFLTGLFLLLVSVYLSYSRMAWFIFILLFVFFLYKEVFALDKEEHLWFLIGVTIAILISLLFFILVPYDTSHDTYRVFDSSQEDQWEWTKRESCLIDPNASCDFSLSLNSLQLFIHPGGDASKEIWLDPVWVRKKVNLFINESTSISWRQYDRFHTGILSLRLLTTNGYRRIYYAACAGNSWHHQGYINLENESGCGTTFHWRNIFKDYLDEYNDSYPISIESFGIGHFYSENANKDIGITVSELTLYNLSFFNSSYLEARNEHHPFYQRLFLNDEENNRTFIYANALNLVSEEPLGIGVGNFRRVFLQRFGADVHHAHNLFLQVLVEVGVLGFILFILLIIIIFRRALQSIPSSDFRKIKISLLVGIIALLLYGLIDFPFYDQRVHLLFWMVVGMLMAISEPGKPLFRIIPEKFDLRNWFVKVRQDIFVFFKKKKNILKTAGVVFALFWVFYIVFVPHIYYSYPFHIDEWRHISQSRSLGDGTISKDLGLFEFGFDTFLLFLSKIGFDLVLQYKYLPGIFSVLSAFLLFVLVYSYFKRYYIALFSIMFFSLLKSNVNILGLWFLTPLTFSFPFLFAFFIFLLRFDEKKDKASFHYLLFSLFVLFIAYPIAGVFGFLIGLLYAILHREAFLKYKKECFWFLVIPLIFFVVYLFAITRGSLISTFGLLFQRIIFEHGYGVIEINFSLINLIGVTQVVLALVSLPFIIKKKKWFFMLWSGVCLFLLLFFSLFDFSILISYQRVLYFLMIGVVPLSSAGLYYIFKLLHVFLKKLLYAFRIKKIVISIIFIIAFFLLFYFLLQNQFVLDSSVQLYGVIDDFDYEALVFLDSLPKQRIITLPQIGVALYPISGHKPVATLYFENKEKRELLEKFFQSSCEEMENVLEQESVSLVLSDKVINCGFKELYHNNKNYVYLYENIYEK
jgi:O-antigen ligase